LESIKQSTINHSGSKKLFDTGHLQASLHFQVNSDSVEVGINNVNYAKFHQFGKTNIQKRRLLPIDNNTGELIDRVAEDIIEFLEEEFRTY